MSRSTATIEFPDGLVLHGVYDGTMSVFRRPLLDTRDEAWDRLGDLPKNTCSCGNAEEVEVWSDYGGGIYLTTRACRTCKTITGTVNPHDQYLFEG